MKNDPTYMCVITIKDGDVKNKVYFPTPVLFINYLLKHILLYADTDSVITIKEGK